MYSAFINFDSSFFYYYLCYLFCSLWEQLFIIGGWFGETWIPLTFALLPGRAQEDYTTLFKIIKDMIGEHCSGKALKIRCSNLS